MFNNSHSYGKPSHHTLTVLFWFQMNKPLFFVAICLLQAISSLGEPIPDPDYSEHKVVNQDSKTSSYTDSYTSDGGNAISSYYAAPRAYYSAPRSYVSYAAPAPTYRYSYPAYYPRYAYAAPAPAAYADDNVYITDNYGRTTSVSKASAYRGFY